MWDNQAWSYIHRADKETEPPFLTQDFIHAIQPEARIIIMLRDPVERWSDRLLSLCHSTCALTSSPVCLPSQAVFWLPVFQGGQQVSRGLPPKGLGVCPFVSVLFDAEVTSILRLQHQPVQRDAGNFFTDKIIVHHLIKISTSI